MPILKAFALSHSSGPSHALRLLMLLVVVPLALSTFITLTAPGLHALQGHFGQPNHRPWLEMGQAHAADNVLSMKSEDDEDVQWNLKADNVTTLGENTIIEAVGAVVLERGNDILKADFARYYTETNWIFLKGNVFVRMGRDDLNADEAEFDLRSKTGWLTNGHVFIEGPHIYFSGERIVKHWGDRYTFNQAKITTCDGTNPAWSMQAEEAVVEIDGYAQLFHSSFFVKQQNIFYTPFMVLPAKTTRQSGLLMPDYGISNKHGFYYNQPYFWVIDESSDMTFYANLMTKTGFMGGVEYRSNRYTDDKIWMTFSGVIDKNRITTPGSSDVYSSSDMLRTNQERYWVRGMADGFIGTTGWRYRSNIDYVSDQDYLREFDSGPLGFSRSRTQLFDMFGRDIQEDDQNRVSQALITKDWSRVGITASLRYEQNPMLGHGNTPHSQDELVQQLPRLDMFLYKGRIFPDLPIEAEAQFSSGYMYRESGTSGLRSEVYPKISIPLDVRYGSLIATAGVRQTFYGNTSTSDDSPFTLKSGGPRQNKETRTVPEFDVQGYTEASRVWEFDDAQALSVTPAAAGTSAWKALRHEIQPRFKYNYVPDVDQEENPFYLSEDRLLSNNELTYSITNIITRKQATVVAEGEGDKQTAKLVYDYFDLLRWRIETGYDFNEADRDKYLSQYPSRPQMDILSDLELNFTSWFGYNGKTYISPYDGELTRHDHNVFFTWANKARWYTGFSFRDQYYDYRRKFRYEDWNNVNLSSPVRLLHNTITINMTPEWGVSITDNRNLREGGSLGRAYDQRLRVTYTAQCYRIHAEYRYNNYDRSYSLLVDIPGLFE